jgi:hypothetical protein
MINKNKRSRILILCSLSILTIISCAAPDWIGSIWHNWGAVRPKPTIEARETQLAENEHESVSDVAEQWNIYQCNAIQDVSIEVVEHELYNDGDGHVECNYTHKITNIGNYPVWFIYYNHYFYGDNEPPVNHQPWSKVTPRQPGESWPLSNMYFSCEKCTPTHFEQIHYSLAAIYDNPACRWITEDEGVHFDILIIAEEEPLYSPCTEISPLIYSESDPDITDGLHH